LTDFFISYTSIDEPWAVWIGHVLEDEAYSVIVQAWDFRPGSNFVLEMQKAASSAERTITVLSPDYLKSQFANPEWAAAFATDPQGLKRSLVPVMVRPCEADGLLNPVVHINLTAVDEEEASKRLLAGVRSERSKPSTRPAYPGPVRHTTLKNFPGDAPMATSHSSPVYLPKVRRAPSDMEKRRFAKQAFETIKGYFEQGLAELSREAPGLECDFQPVTAIEFRAEIFVQGKSTAACRIWLGGSFDPNGISYAEGRHHFGSNSCNEILSLADGDESALSSLMGAGFGFGRLAEHFDLKHLAPEQAAEYLWRRFVANLER
jgi:hypothetical protein